ncbi:hypothetical protein AAFF_G00197940 [Aldrovandia affinis]|uniref:Uncharacterized protein n=1 Tax=Aldrovandia affinis TaxID=143900 RepID=A0AAD7W5S8_9TELE|nr:hypothetical protein AAFF_G00197940 [Aldrovandia affinis]
MNPYHPSIVTGVQRHALQQHPVLGLEIGTERMLCSCTLCWRILALSSAFIFTLLTAAVVRSSAEGGAGEILKFGVNLNLIIYLINLIVSFLNNEESTCVAQYWVDTPTEATEAEELKDDSPTTPEGEVDLSSVPPLLSGLHTQMM